VEKTPPRFDFQSIALPPPSFRILFLPLLSRDVVCVPAGSFQNFGTKLFFHTPFFYPHPFPLFKLQAVRPLEKQQFLITGVSFFFTSTPLALLPFFSSATFSNSNPHQFPTNQKKTRRF